MDLIPEWHDLGYEMTNNLDLYNDTIISFYIYQYHVISWDMSISCCITLYHVVSCCITLYHVVSCDIHDIKCVRLADLHALGGEARRRRTHLVPVAPRTRALQPRPVCTQHGCHWPAQIEPIAHANGIVADWRRSGWWAGCADPCEAITHAWQGLGFPKDCKARPTLGHLDRLAGWRGIGP